MFIEVNGTRLFFDVEGAGLVPDGPRMRAKPSLILLHGGPGADHSMFKPFFSRLADVAQVIYLDQRGNGRSAAASPATWNLAQWGDDVKAFCDALGIDRPIVFGGSFGGFVAQSYATRHPAHPGKLILSSTAARIDYEAIFASFEALGGPAAREVAREHWTTPSSESRRRYFATCLPLYRQRPGGDPDAARRAIIRDDVALWFNGQGNEHGRMDFRAALARVPCPVLVLAGEKDPICPLPFSETIAACLAPDLVRFEVFPDCGHGVQFDDPERALRVIREFIEG